MVAVFALALGAVAWSARTTYRVALDDNEVVIIQGPEGGLLWFDETIEERTGILAEMLTEAQLLELESGKEQPDRSAADTYVDNLRGSISTTTTTSTSTTVFQPPAATATTLAALREAKDRGALALGVVNSVGSTISRETDTGVYLHVGPEIGVASTKAFMGQVAVLTLLSLFIGRRKYLSDDMLRSYLGELEAMPDMITKILQQSDMIRDETAKLIDRENWLFLGRGYNYPVALEGALKLKEISYIHAEGMPAAEMKHGPIALIDEGMPVVFVVPRGSQYDKAISNIEEVRSRGGRIIAVADEDDTQIEQYAEAVFRIPHVSEPLQPLLSVVPLQLLAYHAAVLRGHDVDKPRNLAKSVTVE